MRILVTGSSGFVGRNLILRLLKDPTYQTLILPVRNADKLKAQLKSENLEFDNSRIEIIQTEAPLWNALDGLQVDQLVHCAGLLFARERDEFFETNVEGSLRLFEKVRFNKAIVLSSQAASGPCLDGQKVKSEKDQDSPITWYGRSKLEMEQELLKKHAHLNFICLRPPMILGARDTATLPLFKMVKSRLLFKPGLAPKHYSYISVNELVEGIHIALKSDRITHQMAQRTYYIASSQVITDEDLIVTAAKAAEKPGFLIKVPQPLLKGVAKIVDAVPSWRKAIPSLSGDRAIEIWPNRWVISAERFASDFSWTSKESLMATLRETYDWYVKTGDI